MNTSINKNQIIELFNSMSNSNLSLDEKLFEIYKKFFPMQNFEEAKNEILNALNINQFNYYTSAVDKKLKTYINRYIFPKYNLNDQGHGILHIKEVIRRSFALNDTFKLNLNPNLIYTISACHDLGKYISHENHHMIAAEKFYNNKFFKNYFNDNERKTIKEAIEDHRSSKEDEPRSIYGKLISSADRNTTIEIVFIRSFYVALERTPDMKIEEYLDFTLNRLRKKYDETNPENMFFEDKIYSLFLKDMRALLSKPKEFNNKYCQVNKIDDTNYTVKQIHNKREMIWKRK